MYVVICDVIRVLGKKPLNDLGWRLKSAAFHCDI